MQSKTRQKVCRSSFSKIEDTRPLAQRSLTMSVLPLRSIITSSFIACLLGVAITLLLESHGFQRHNLQDSNVQDCRTPDYTVRLLSYDPLIMHVENFITPHERQYLQKVSYVRRSSFCGVYLSDHYLEGNRFRPGRVPENHFGQVTQNFQEMTVLSRV